MVDLFSPVGDPFLARERYAEAGRAVEQGTHAALMDAGGLYARLVRTQAFGALPEAATQGSPHTQPPLVPRDGRAYNPVVTLNGWTLPWRMNAGVKEFHLVAEPVVREMAQKACAENEALKAELAALKK